MSEITHKELEDIERYSQEVQAQVKPGEVVLSDSIVVAHYVPRLVQHIRALQAENARLKQNGRPVKQGWSQ